MKKIFTLIAASLMAVSASAQTPKEFTETTVFLPTADNVATAFAEGWLHGEKATTKLTAGKAKADIDPSTGEKLAEPAEFPAVRAKVTGSMQVKAACKSVKSVTFYAVTSSASESRTLTVNITPAPENVLVKDDDGNMTPPASHTVTATSDPTKAIAVTIDNLAPEKEYKFKIAGMKAGDDNWPGEMMLYGIKFEGVNLGGADGISNIETEKPQTTAVYNLAGQRVNANAKGIVIKNGKKYVQ